MIEEIARITSGTIYWGEKKKSFKRKPIFSHFHFDSRQITQGNSLFFALKGEANDGHQYLRQLENPPGVGAVISMDYDVSGLKIPCVRVKDPLNAAQELARYIRTKYQNIKYVGVTGSAGKTTTKEFIFQLLSHKGKSFRSFQNWNNWIGLPFSLLNMSGEEKFAVFELAMSEPGIGEIDLLSSVLKPNIAIILNVFPVHLEYLKTLENVARAKAEILNYLTKTDIALINGDSQPLNQWLNQSKAGKKNVGAEQILFGRNSNNNVYIRDIQRMGENSFNQTRMVISSDGRDIEYDTSLINPLHLENLFVAILVAQRMGMTQKEIQTALHQLRPLDNRGGVIKQGRLIVVNETYNSNPEALKRSLDWVSKEYKKKDNCKKIAVLGDMLELGKNETKYHQEAGHFFTSLDFDYLITVGKRAEHIAEGAKSSGFPAGYINQFPNSKKAGEYLKKMTTQNENAKCEFIILLKASRGIQLEKALQELSQ